MKLGVDAEAERVHGRRGLRCEPRLTIVDSHIMQHSRIVTCAGRWHLVCVHGRQQGGWAKGWSREMAQHVCLGATHANISNMAHLSGMHM